MKEKYKSSIWDMRHNIHEGLHRLHPKVSDGWAERLGVAELPLEGGKGIGFDEI